MAKDDADGKRSTWLTLLGNAVTVVAALIAAGAAIYTARLTAKNGADLARLELDSKNRQFQQELDRQYLVLTYPDLSSGDKERLERGLAMLNMMAPELARRVAAGVAASPILVGSNRRLVEAAVDNANLRVQAQNFTVSVHLTSAQTRTDAVRQQVSAALSAVSVKAYNFTQSPSSGATPRIEFFSEADRPVAELIARQISSSLPPGTPVQFVLTRPASQAGSRISLWL